MTFNHADLPDHKSPYLLDKLEVVEFIKFWEEFLFCFVEDQPVFFRSLRLFSQANEKFYSEDYFLDLYLTVELLLSTDFTRSLGKAEAIDRRINRLLRGDPLFGSDSKAIIQSLRQIRNDLAHTGRVNQSNRDDLIGKLASCTNSSLTEEDLLIIFLDFIRRVLWSFWNLLKQNDYDEQSCFHIISILI